VEATFVRYPIPLLQVVGSESIPFLYHADWEEGQSIAQLRREGRDVVRFLPGVPHRLVTLGPLLRPLIELHWTRDVARWTGIDVEEDRLRSHLFGTGRATVPRQLRWELIELQEGGCFYCGDRLRGGGEVDHFLAWSRWPNDAVENLVVADRCNGHKSDHLAASGHVGRWASRFEARGADLVQLAHGNDWPSDPGRTAGLITTTYAHVAPGTPLWVEGTTFEQAPGPIRVERL
jgi:hypothetical protein